MAKEWLEELANQIKEQHRDVAEAFTRDQHRANVIAVEGRVFFGDVVRALEENFSQLKKLLQGDATSAEIAILTTGTTQIHLTRSRFPWFDAHLGHENEDITLEYGKDAGIPDDPANAGKCTVLFHIHVSDDDKLSFEDTSVEPTKTYDTADELAQRVTEILFGL